MSENGSRIAMISIIVEDLEQSGQINQLLHEYSPYVIGRMGIPYRQKMVSLICVAVDAPEDVTSALTGRLGRIPGISVKTAFAKR